MRLQKLVYYCQAWGLVWDDKPLFKEEIEAWVNGPVVPELYEFHTGRFNIKTCSKGNSSKLSNNQKDTINAVLKAYRKKSTQWLIDLTHMEDPWIKSRIGLVPSERGDNLISWESMKEYYSGL